MPLNGEIFPVELLVKVIAGILSGLAYGGAAAWGKGRISSAWGEKWKGGAGGTSMLWVLGINAVRMLVNIGAFGAVFFLRHDLPVPFTAVAVGTAVGLTGDIWLLAARRSGRGTGRRKREGGEGDA